MVLMLLVGFAMTGLGFVIGWFCHGARSSRTAGAPRETGSAAGSPAGAEALSRAYADGYEAGCRVAVAGRNGERSTLRSAPPPPLSAPSGPRYPASMKPHASLPPAPAFPVPRPAGAQPGPPATAALPGPAPQAAGGLRWQFAGQPMRPSDSAPARPVPPLSEEESAELAAAGEARRRQRDLRNINITLYAACLLLVAAASLFIGLAISETARFAGVSLVTVLFYAGGLTVHLRSTRLRPAAVAFTGTGLALIPVIGLALHNFVLHDAPLAWLATSVAGTAAFAYAAARLDSRVVAYLSMTFLLSAALASGAALRSGIMWYFLFTVMLATAVSLLALRRPPWLRNIYLDAFVHSHRFLVPAAAAVALLTGVELGGWQFSLLFLAFSCYYAVMFAQTRGKERLACSYGFRITATAGLAVLAYKLTDDAAAAVLVLSLLLLVQAAGLLALRRDYSSLGGAPLYVPDYVLLLALQALAGITAGLSAAGARPGGGTGQILFTATAAAVLLTFLAGAWMLAAVPEAAPAAAALLGFLPRLGGMDTGPLWPAVFLGLLLGTYYAVRAARSSGAARSSFSMGARAVAAALVPVLVMAFLEAAGAEAGTAWTWSLLSAVAAVTGNQLISVYSLRRKPSAAREVPSEGTPAEPEAAAVGIAAGLAAVLTLGLRFAEYPETAVTLGALFAGLALNVLTSLMLRGFTGKRHWLEWMAPAGFAAAGVLGAGLLGVRGYEAVLGGALAYTGYMAARGEPRASRRGGYLLAGQMLLTVLVALAAVDLDLTVGGVFLTVAVSAAVQLVLRTLLQDRLAAAGPGQLAAAQWGSVGLLVLLVLGYDAVTAEPRALIRAVLLAMAASGALWIQASAVARRLAGKPVPYHASTLGTAAALAAALTVWLRLAEPAGAALTVWVLFAALAVNALTSLLLHRFFAPLSRVEWIGPAGFAAAGAVGAGLLGTRGYEVLTVAALGYCAILAARAGDTALRNGYLLAGQALLTVLAAVVAAADLDLAVHGVFVVVAASVAALQTARMLLQDRFPRAGLRGLGATALWGSAGVLVLLPLVYAAAAGADVQRHVSVVALALLSGMTAAAFAAGSRGPVLYVAVCALGMLPLVLTNVFGFSSSGTAGRGTPDVPAPLSLAGAGIILLGFAALALAGESRRSIPLRVRNPLLCAAVLYCFLALALADVERNLLLTGIGFLLTGAGFLAVSFTRRIPWLAAGAAAMVPAAAWVIRSWLIRDVLLIDPEAGAARLWPGFAAALVLHAAAYVLSVLPQTAATALRRGILAAGAALIAAAAGISVMPYDHASAVYGSAVLIAAAAAAVQQFPPARREHAGEAAAMVAAAAVQRIVWYFVDGTGWFWLLQYWVVVVAALAAYEFRRGRALRGTVVLSASAVLLSCTGLSSIVSADTAEQVWALLAHACLLAFGVLSSRRLFTVWGASGVALAVLWYLRGYTFLLLVLLAAALIALAVWRLTRLRTDAEGEAGG